MVLEFTESFLVSREYKKNYHRIKFMRHPDEIKANSFPILLFKSHSCIYLY
jgi:hypothetical protein